MKKSAILAMVAFAVLLLYWLVSGIAPDGSEDNVSRSLPDGALASVTLPDSLTASEQRGERSFNATCAACHGINAQGLEGNGPPLVHKIYEPGHHGDMAFLVAVTNGVRAHHWKFGNMPPVKGITKAEVADIVAYVRALQRANGIE